MPAIGDEANDPEIEWIMSANFVSVRQNVTSELPSATNRLPSP